MKSAVINFKVERTLKKKAHQKATALGVSLSDVLNGYLRKFIKTKAIEFVSEDETLVPTAYLKRLLKENEKDIKAGKVSPAFDNAEDALKWLHDPDACYENGSKV